MNLPCLDVGSILYWIQLLYSLKSNNTSLMNNPASGIQNPSGSTELSVTNLLVPGKEEAFVSLLHQ